MPNPVKAALIWLALVVAIVVLPLANDDDPLEQMVPVSQMGGAHGEG